MARQGIVSVSDIRQLFNADGDVLASLFQAINEMDVDTLQAAKVNNFFANLKSNWKPRRQLWWNRQAVVSGTALNLTFFQDASMQQPSDGSFANLQNNGNVPENSFAVIKSIGMAYIMDPTALDTAAEAGAIVDMDGNARFEIWFNQKKFYLPFFAIPTPSKIEFAQFEEVGEALAVVGLLANVVQKTQGWWFLDPQLSVPGGGNVRIIAQSDTGYTITGLSIQLFVDTVIFSSSDSDSE